MRTVLCTILLLLAALSGLAQSFDSKRDPSADLQAAMTEAQRTGKHILLDVGGDWCIFCQQMAEFFRQKPDLAKVRDDNFIVVPVYYGDDNKNAQFLSHYAKPQGIPHFYVLDDHGRPLHWQHVLELRDGSVFSPEKMKAFLLHWAPSATQ